MRGAVAKPERIKLRDAAAIVGGTMRTVQALAARGQIPGASKLGGLWYFDEAALRKWVRDGERCQQKHQSTLTGEAGPYGLDSPLQDENIARACAQMTQRLRERALGR